MTHHPVLFFVPKITKGFNSTIVYMYTAYSSSGCYITNINSFSFNDIAFFLRIKNTCVLDDQKLKLLHSSAFSCIFYEGFQCYFKHNEYYKHNNKGTNLFIHLRTDRQRHSAISPKEVFFRKNQKFLTVKVDGKGRKHTLLP